MKRQSSGAQATAWKGKLTYQVFSHVTAISVNSSGEITREEAHVGEGKTQGLALLQPPRIRAIVFQDPFRALGMLAAGTYDLGYTRQQRAALRRHLLAEVRRFK
jgi:hypothetical protein